MILYVKLGKKKQMVIRATSFTNNMEIQSSLCKLVPFSGIMLRVVSY